jgi:pSer/pThr/pTyr-binding forkhead associated (FHA) protein
MMLLAAAATLDRALRLGTLEITAALALVAVLAARPRVRTAADVGALTPMNVEIEILEHGNRRALLLKAPFEVGRTREAELFLHDPEVSRRHARFESQGRVLYVEDLKSSNGTFLNGERIAETIEVREGDTVDVGTTRLVIRSVRRS